MRKAQQKELMNKIILDKNLTTGHIKTLIYFTLNDNVMMSDVSKILDCSQQYTSKIFQDLKKLGYIKAVGKIEHTRILVWSLNIQE